jgi:hypothetical protein
MEEFIVEALKWLLAKSDPTLITCFIVLAVWQWKTSKLIAKHIDPSNKHPHQECELGERSYQLLKDSLEQQHIENREDHLIIFNLLRGIPVSEETFTKKRKHEP